MARSCGAAIGCSATFDRSVRSDGASYSVALFSKHISQSLGWWDPSVRLEALLVEAGVWDEAYMSSVSV
jgi:hypothetical protein